MRGIVTLAAALARAETARAVIQELESKAASPDVEMLRREYQAHMRPGRTEPEAPRGPAAGRRVRPAPCAGGPACALGHWDDAFHAAEEEIDLLELTASTRIRPSVEGDVSAADGARKPQ